MVILVKVKVRIGRKHYDPLNLVMSELKIEVAHNNFELKFMKFAAQLKVRNLK